MLTIETLFLEYMAGCKGYATTAGFESVCEAMYLQKPVLMVPTHIKQECNALDAMLSDTEFQPTFSICLPCWNLFQPTIKRLSSSFGFILPNPFLCMNLHD